MIVDASVAVKWLTDEAGSDAAYALVGKSRLIAPELVLSEVGNAIWKKRRRGEVDHLDVTIAKLIDVYDRLEPTSTLIDAALALAIRLDHPIYDCMYLALAERDDVALVTADPRFLSVCRAKGFAGRVQALGDEG